MNQNFIPGLLLFLTLFACSPKWETKSYYANYLTNISSESPTLIFPFLVNTPFNERDAALSPDGQMLIYSFKYANQYVLLFTELVKGIWTKPNVLPFSGQYSDLEPCFSPDGSYLFFSSNRPIDKGNETKDFDLWVVEKENSGWSAPVNLGTRVNSQYNEFYPSVSEDMTLYFCSKNDKCIGGEDLWFSEQISPGQWGEPQNLGDSINTSSDEYNAFVHPQEKYIIFTTHGRGKGIGSGDLWVSFHKGNQEWTRPKNMGEIVNTPYFEFSPSISADGQLLFFTSNQLNPQKDDPTPLKYSEITKIMMQVQNGNQDIYCIRTDFIDDFRSKNISSGE
ncbi:MAG: PD40 domain-containing protein [Candidatus Marinimicrobia bacterium]|nr:PD40 domain-containing protein [Candidatus Neomarinimicrobiota bacterium]